MKSRNSIKLTVAIFLVWQNCSTKSASAQGANTVTATVEIKSVTKAKSSSATTAKQSSSEVVLWLMPVDRAAPAPQIPAKHPQLVQRNKSFEPHLLVVPVGSTVDFPNRDPFFHNVFSLFDGKRFDLGLYEAGASNSVRFDRVGVSLLFCNIHPEMSAVVVALGTPYYGISGKTGAVTIRDVPDGRYELRVWYERSLPGDLKSVSRVVNISSVSRNLGVVAISENPGFSLTHTNKYGQDYTPPPTQTYPQP